MPPCSRSTSARLGLRLLAPPTPHGTRLGSREAPPVLLIASEHDPVTPIEGAWQLRMRLPGSRLVVIHDDYSHGVFASRGNACVDSAAAAHLVDGTVPATDVHCVGPGLPTPRVPNERVLSE